MGTPKNAKCGVLVDVNRLKDSSEGIEVHAKRSHVSSGCLSRGCLQPGLLRRQNPFSYISHICYDSPEIRFRRREGFCLASIGITS
jgi:hypothetical protein